ncbi:MAG: peptidoglycan DD-metalloendopeptidase family protein [Gammaproteobacteria bacterium]
MDQHKKESDLTLFGGLYQWTLEWCRKRHAKVYLGFLSFTEAIFFPIPPDVMLAPMVLAKPTQAWQLAALTTLTSVLGGVAGYLLGLFAFETLGVGLIEILNLESFYDEAVSWFQRFGFIAIFIAGVTPIPYKVFTLAAGASQMAIVPFVLASLISRALRFYFVAGCMRYFGQSISFRKKHIAAICLAMMTLMMGCSGPVEMAPMESLSLEPVTSGVHDVVSGDTIYSIAWRYNRDYRELASLNHLSEPYRLQAGQRLALGKGVSTASLSREYDVVPETSFKAESNQVQPSLRFEPVEVSDPVEPLKSAIQVESQPQLKVNDNLSSKTMRLPPSKGRWMWPVEGQIMNRFIPSGPKVNKGIDILSSRGTPVHATSNGKVVYAGNGLRGYGNLIIIKHDEEFLSAYAHNETLLAKEGETVKQGQVIAKVGASGSDRPKLHFEIRYRGQPVDPLKYLPG